MLSKVTTQTMAVPFTRFNRHFGHKASIGPGRYPVKTAELFIDLIKGVVANAQNEGLTTQNLVIKRVVVQTGAKSFKPSRIRGLTTKNTHVEMIVEQLSPKKDKKPTAKVQPEVKA
jgi:ribosomal protein L22